MMQMTNPINHNSYYGHYHWHYYSQNIIIKRIDMTHDPHGFKRARFMNE